MSRTVLEEAEELVSGSRTEDYGPPKTDFDCDAKMFNAYLYRKYTSKGLVIELDAPDVAMFLVIVKIGRQANKPKRDNLVDMAGYIRCLELVLEES